jgi:hypothetical protein
MKKEMMLVLIVGLAVFIVGCGTSAPPTGDGGAPPPSNQVTPPPAPLVRHKVGERVNANGIWDITIDSTRVMDIDGSLQSVYSKPNPGNTYFVIHASVKNRSTTNEKLVPDVQFSLKDEDGEKYPLMLLSSIDHSLNGVVETGGKTKGEVAFEIPLSQKKVILGFLPEPGSTDISLWDIEV